MDLIHDSAAFELHPVSGEIDIGDVEESRYRRLDEETLQARLEVKDLELVVIYLWCQGDEEVGGTGWRVSEVKPFADEGENAILEWNTTIAEADEKAREKMLNDAIQQGQNSSLKPNASTGDDAADDGDDAEYWAQYDDTLGRTPATDRSPAPPPVSNNRPKTTSEAEYFARYKQVQPEMDNDDPSENRNAIGDSTLNGNVMLSSINQVPKSGDAHAQDNPAILNGVDTRPVNPNISHPSASSPGSGPAAITKMEDSAESQSVAEAAVGHYVSTNIKSMFRMCRSTGMERSDFDEMIRTELDTLSMMEDD